MKTVVPDMPEFARSYADYVAVSKSFARGGGRGKVSGVRPDGRETIYELSTGYFTAIDEDGIVTFSNAGQDNLDYFARDQLRGRRRKS